MRYTFLVIVDTDYTNIDAPTAEQIRNEILSNLEYEAYKVGITGVTVSLQRNFDYRTQVERSHEQ